MRHQKRASRWAHTVLPWLLGALPLVSFAVNLKVTLIAPADDPRLERNRLERAYLGHAGGEAADGVRVALKEAQLELEAAQVSVTLEVLAADSLASAQAMAAKAEKAGAGVLITDLPAAWTLAVTDAVKLPVLNVGNAENRLREQDCRARLLHVLPSERMRADALAQTLVAARWQQVLVLSGPSAEDAQRSAVVQAAIKRYGLKLVGIKPFKLSADPRERDLANPRLLTHPSTAGGAYDVVWVVDSDGEFARTVPYRSVLPRPVVGDAGLVALAWHAQFERFGAPQVSRRFTKATQRPMGAVDWAAWMAGKALVSAAVARAQAPKTASSITLTQALERVELDGSKGIPLTFRPWDGQLRQRVLLTDGQGVVSFAPVEGMLHPRNTLDTLGADAPENRCQARK